MRPSWKEDELQNWCSTISNKLLLVVLWGFIFRIFMLYLFEDLPGGKVVYFNGIFLVAFLEHRVTASTNSKMGKVVGCYVYVELMQVYLYILTLYADPAHTVFYCMASTVFCLNYQITINTSSFMVIFYILKQFLSWTMISASVGLYKYTTFFPYMPMIMITLLTISVNGYRQRLASDKWKLLESVSNQERRLLNVMQAIPDGVVVVTSTKEVTTWNDELCRLLLTHPTSSSIKSSMECLTYESGSKKTDSPNSELWLDILSFIESSQPPQTFGTTLVDGRFLEWKGRRGFWDQTKACILTVRDFTDWVQLKEKLQRESSAKTALLRSVSHELRTPTNAVINLVREVIEEEILTPRSAEDLKLVSICTHFLLSMINDLLDYSKLLAGQFTLTKTQFNLSQEIHQTFMLFDPQCRAKRLDYMLNIDPLLPKVVYSDPNRLKQVLLNLLSNSVKYLLFRFTMSGFIRILVLSASAGRMKISVIDSGIGIAKKKQSCLFKLFGMIKGNEGLNPTGCGLGLSIANALAFELGGREIELDSDEGQGSVFSFYVYLTPDQSPISELEEDQLSSSQGQIYEVPKETNTYVCVPRLVKSEHSFMKAKPPPAILVVDDAEFNRLVMRKILTSLFLSSDESTSGLQALRQIQKSLRERGHCYKVILMDLEMPEMDGITATKAIIDMVKVGELPFMPCIIACSAYSSNEDKTMCSEAGMRGYLEKPVSKESLRAVLRECM